MLEFWLDWNAVKDVVGSRPLAAGGENQNEQDPTQLRSYSDNHGQNNYCETRLTKEDTAYCCSWGLTWDGSESISLSTKLCLYFLMYF